MLYVPILIAVDTNSDDEAIEAAKVVAENTEGESFHLVPVADARTLVPGESCTVTAPRSESA